MSTNHLKLFLIIIWVLVVSILGVGLVLWVVTRKPAPPAPTPTLSPTPLATPSATDIPTIVIIRATPRGTLIPLPATSTPITPQAAYNADSAPPGVNPLTGLGVADPSRLERRPIAVKISSFPREAVRAVQSGLTKADLVFEYYIEDGLTRFVAVYYGQDAERVGPVRSGRYFDENVMRMYHSALVFADADRRVEEYFMSSVDLRPLLFLPRNDNCPPLCRDDNIDGYNNIFVNTAGVGAFLSDNGKQPVRPMFFNSLFHSGLATPITRIFTRYSAYSYNYWEYDPTQQKYLRFSDANNAHDGAAEVYAPHIDHLTGQQVFADNVVALVAPHLFVNDFDRADQLYNIPLIGDGLAYVFIDGKMYKGYWVRDHLDRPYQLFDMNNNPLSLKPGITYHQIIDPKSTVTQNGLSMSFGFYIQPRILTPTPTPPKRTATPRKK